MKWSMTIYVSGYQTVNAKPKKFTDFTPNAETPHFIPIFTSCPHVSKYR